ncbi:MAG: hypothetical protein CBC29_00530 [Methylococcaceae bacterium TMED69]|nr:MAG: hypothetical protein CBC29_00530 [Methylococcaceae bacterium TMED69]|tara:strand:- start:102 stop:314 length:213 start_codon:yes stop_codon:yes gene_type:complete
MRFSENKYYIEKYIKCDNCGMLIYGDGLKSKEFSKLLFCSDWCIDWYKSKSKGNEDPRIPLPKSGIHEIN